MLFPEDTNGTSAVSASKTSRKRAATKKDVQKQKARLKAMAAKKSADAIRLNELRIRILLFIGKLGGEVSSVVSVGKQDQQG